MIYVSIAIILALISLEISGIRLCDKKGDRRLFHAASMIMLKHFRRNAFYERYRQEQRRSGPMDDKKAGEAAERSFLRICTNGLKLLLLLAISVIILELLPDDNKDENTLVRPEVGEEAVKVKVSLTKDGREKAYDLLLGAREYSSTEFRALTDKAYAYLSEEIMGENEDLDSVMHDLVFPETDETGTIRVSWYSDNSELIGIDGRVNSRDISEACSVRVSAALTDGIHDRELTWTIRVVPYVEGDWSETVENALKAIEEGSREDAKLILPEQVDGADIKAEKNEDISIAAKLMAFGMVLIVCYMVLQFSRIRRKAEERQDELLGRYSFFVSSIVLKVGSGLSIRETLLSIYSELSERGIRDALFEELNYAVNGLKAGRDEKAVYSEMGRGTGVEEYSRLMALITRNLERGNSNLLELLRKEETDAFNKRKLRARRKGEEAAEKLLIPMFILLVTVIGIVMFPALKNF